MSSAVGVMQKIKVCLCSESYVVRAMRFSARNMPLVGVRRGEDEYKSRCSDTACTDCSAADLVGIEDQLAGVKFEIETLGLVLFEYRCITCEARECNMVRGEAIQKGRIQSV